MIYIRFSVFVSAVVAIFQMLWGCANVQPPTGGDKDTTAPVIYAMKPSFKQLNYSGSTIELQFSEIVQIKNLRKELIINPPLKYPLKAKEGKNKIIFSIKDTLAPNTTYTFNFRNAISDVTESNPVKDLVVIFSTGAYIDSLKVQGQAINYYTKEKINENGILLLYQTGDTVGSSTPAYYAELNENGIFDLQNIKHMPYQAVVFHDVNKNSKLDTKTESYSLFNVNPDTNLLYKQSLIKIDTSRLKTESKKQEGNKVKVEFNKNILEAKVIPLSNFKHYFHFEKGKNMAEIYPITELEGDTLKFNIELQDTIGTWMSDTIQLFFEPDTSSKNKLTASPVLEYENFGKNKKTFVITFSEPVTAYTGDSIMLITDRDTLSIEKAAPKWSENKKKLSFAVPENVKDSIIFYSPDSAWQSHYSAYAPKISYNKDLSNEEDYGTIEGNILQEKPVIVQLLNEKYETVKEVIHHRQFKFVKVKPGTYRLRYIIDENENKQWDINLDNPAQSEKIIYFKDKILLKPNWEITDQDF